MPVGDIDHRGDNGMPSMLNVLRTGFVKVKISLVQRIVDFPYYQHRPAELRCQGLLHKGLDVLCLPQHIVKLACIIRQVSLHSLPAALHFLSHPA